MLTYAPGSDLDEVALCERFTLSRTPLRQVFHDLASAVRCDRLADVVDGLVSRGVHGLITEGSTGENYVQAVVKHIETARFTSGRL